MKKADKGCEGRIKATELKFLKFDNFFMSIGLLGVLYSLIWVVLSFKAKKVKKAALVATNTKLQNGKFLASKICLKHPKNASKPPLIGIWFVKLSAGLLEAKRPIEGQKI